MIHICPYCMNPVPHYDNDYIGELQPVNVDNENFNCGALQSNVILNNAKCSNIQGLKVNGGKIAKKLKLNQEQKELFFNKIIEIKRKKNRLKDYIILEIAINSVI
ncbi:hypothetical protein [Methanococcus voltae]|uniref:Uncharacterized protein n=1 Tax=Methanococcus voltae (strain ATCC BAA-1334 / A3) TaxID=456320 RepID=D7DQP5_METV3|nr:hypothetical protein [Methanococcus voltae]MCS3900832.1 hypothetical protein [Methanococcus voltae]